jgi:flagellar biogenesis protein FliO
MNRLFSFFKNSSENRTQFFIVMGFIILPVVCLSYVFFVFVVDREDETSQRLKIPPHILESQK